MWVEMRLSMLKSFDASLGFCLSIKITSFVAWIAIILCSSQFFLIKHIFDRTSSRAASSSEQRASICLWVSDLVWNLSINCAKVCLFFIVLWNVVCGARRWCMGFNWNIYTYFFSSLLMDEHLPFVFFFFNYFLFIRFVLMLDASQYQREMRLNHFASFFLALLYSFWKRFLLCMCVLDWLSSSSIITIISILKKT